MHVQLINNIKVNDKIYGMSKAAKRAAHLSVIAMTLYTVSRVKRYPRATDVNKPGRKSETGHFLPYYHRNVGMKYAIQPRGNPTPIEWKLVKGGESEMLGKQWAHRFEDFPGGWIGIFWNSASYAKYVHGDEDDQAGFHADRGWASVDKWLKTNKGKVDKIGQQAAQKYLKAISMR